MNLKPIIKYVAGGLMAVGLYACSDTDTPSEQGENPQSAAKIRIDSLQTVTRQKLSEGKMPETKTTLYLIQALEYYAGDYPDDSLSGLYLRKAGELYESVLNDKPKAIKRYMEAYNTYGDFEQRPMALFRAASLYQDMGDTTQAIKNFRLFIENHPEHGFADDAENMIHITRIGMEEFIRRSIEKSKTEETIQ